MAIYCEAISVIIRKSTIKLKLGITPADLIRKFPGGSIWDDENLVRFGFMAPQDAGVWVRQLQDLGLVFYDQVDAGFRSRDIVVIDQIIGPTCECAWIESRIEDGVRWAWEANKPEGSFDPPADLADRNMIYVPLSESSDFPWSSDFASQLDATIDQNSGRTWYIGRPYLGQQIYDGHIRSAVDELNLNHFRSALTLFIEAEKIKSLDVPHRIPAAIAHTRVVLEINDMNLAQKALLRWKEITEIGPGEKDATCWEYRAAVEQILGFYEDSKNSKSLASSLKSRGNY